MKEEIRILVKLPGKPWSEERIPNTLKALQEKVGGNIETVTVADNACLICNKEGRITDLPYNCCFMGADFYGPLLFVGTDGEDFTDCSISIEVIGR